MEEKMGEKVEKIGKIERLDPKAQIADVTDAQDIAELESRSKFDAAITKAERNWDHSQAASITQVNSTQETAVTRPSLIEDISFSEKKIQRLQPASIDQITAQARSPKRDARTHHQAYCCSGKQPTRQDKPYI